MAGTEVPGRLLSFLEAAVPELALLEPGESPESYADGTLLLSTDADPTQEDSEVVASVPIGAAAKGRRLAIGVAGGQLTADARGALGAIAAADRDDSPTAPLDQQSGAALFCLARARRSRRVLDVGSGAGASAIWLASAVAPRGRVVSIERDSAMRVLAQRNLRGAGLLDGVELRLGETERLLPGLSGRLDLVLLHEDPQDRADDLESVLHACAPGALIVSPGGRRQAKELSVYNATVRSHPRLRTSVDLATASGLTLSLVS